MIRYIDKSGSSPDDAIVILGAKNAREGVRAAMDYMTAEFGARGKGWQLELEQIVRRDGRVYDAMKIVLSSGKRVTLYFDISDYFGKR